MMIKLRALFCTHHKTKAYEKLMKLQEERLNIVRQAIKKMDGAETTDDMFNVNYETLKKIATLDGHDDPILEEIAQEKKKNFEEYLISMDVDPEDIKLLYKNKDKTNINKKKNEILIDKPKMEQQQQQAENVKQEETKKIYVPDNLEIRNLKTTIKLNRKLLLIGVQRQNAQHAQYVYDALFNLKPEMIMTDFPVDDPIFIRTETNYKATWKQFLQQIGEQTFLINPQPKSLSDIHLHQNKIKWLFENNIKKNPELVVNPTDISEILESTFKKQFEIIDILKTPFLYSYHHPTSIIVNGYPELNYRYQIQENSSIKQLKGLLKQKLDAKKEKKYNFDPLLLEPQLFISPKIKFMVEIIKLAATSYKTGVILVESNKVNQIEEEWIKTSHSKICQNLQEYIHPIKPLNEADEVIKKLVLLDLLLSPFIYENFVKYNSFPYQFTSKHKMSFLQVWENLQNQYLK